MKLLGFLAFAALMLAAIAWFRAPEYDEAYAIFLTAGHARPAWPSGIFTAGSVRYLYAGHASFAQSRMICARATRTRPSISGHWRFGAK
jgi:hypothetical protein